MSAPRIAIATCVVKPEPDPDEVPLLDALRARGAEAVTLAWDAAPGDEGFYADPGVFDLIVLRSTWNYPVAPERFLAWIDGVAGRTRLLNPPEVVRWNAHKRYLDELSARGLPVVPTRFVGRGASIDLAAACDGEGWGDVVVKPSISASSYMTRRFTSGETTDGQTFLDTIVRERDAMVQPFLRSVERTPERSVVWIDGVVTHAVEKRARWAGGEESVSGPCAALPEEIDMLRRALGDRVGSLLYARIDFMIDDDGRRVVSELELLEPSLFLRAHAPALERFADAIVREARRGNGSTRTTP